MDIKKPLEESWNKFAKLNYTDSFHSEALKGHEHGFLSGVQVGIEMARSIYIDPEMQEKIDGLEVLEDMGRELSINS